MLTAQYAVCVDACRYMCNHQVASYPGSFPRTERGNEPGDEANHQEEGQKGRYCFQEHGVHNNDVF